MYSFTGEKLRFYINATIEKQNKTEQQAQASI